MTCHEFRNRVADLFDREAEPQLRAELERHIGGCPQCRAYYEELKDMGERLRPRHSPVEMPSRVSRPLRRWQRIAATLVGIAFLGGVAWAVVGYRLKSSPTNETPTASVTTPLPPGEGQGDESALRFDNVSLDSILTVISRHYGKTVRFCNEEARTMQLIMTWNPSDSLGEFIGRLNMFEGLHITLQADTLVVESGPTPAPSLEGGEE